MKKGDEFIKVFKSIVKKCKDHLVDHLINGKRLKLSDLSNLASCLSDKNGRPPVLYVKVPTEYGTGKVIPEFYEKKEIDGPDKLSKLIEDPYEFKNKECIVNAAIRFDSIFIKGKIISLQVKLYEVEMTPTD